MTALCKGFLVEDRNSGPAKSVIFYAVRRPPPRVLESVVCGKTVENTIRCDEWALTVQLLFLRM